MSLTRKFGKFITRRGKRAHKQHVTMTNAVHTEYAWGSAQNMAAIKSDLKKSYNMSQQQTPFMFNQSGVKMIPLQTKNKGFAGITNVNNSDFSKMDPEHFVHSIRRENPEEFRLADLEEVESIIIEDKPQRNENSTMDAELVQFFGFVTKKLASNTRGLQNVQ